MRRKEALPELLSPAGDFECLVAAVEGGADAVYVGGKRFGARAFAKNFDMDELARAVVYCHLHRVKLYVTVNTLVEDKELPELVDYAAELYRIGVDALIIADLGAISEIKKYVPELTLHASTQMSVHNTLGANAATSLGVTRCVVARELPLDEIKRVVDCSECEIEVFLHGALCVCHSGQCLFSSLVGGRSGNRGECAQPCRLPFNGKYPLSLKDLSLASHIEELIDSGVSSLKIEGRMKSPTYVYNVTKIYRALLDGHRSANSEEGETLRRAFSRGGFTDGYFIGKKDMPMTGIRSEEDKKDSKELPEISFSPSRISVRAEVVLKLGEKAKMILTDGEKTVTVFGDVPVEAQSSPLTEDGVKDRLSKMGNTFLSLSPTDIDLTLDGGINLPPSSLNALRRVAAQKLESCTRELDSPVYVPEHAAKNSKMQSLQAFSRDALDEAYRSDRAAFSGFDAIFRPLFSSPTEASNGVALPPVVFDSELDSVKRALAEAAEQGEKYALIENIGHISLTLESGLIPIGDFRLNVTNTASALAYRRLGVDHLILSPELTLPKARDIGGAVITYGRIPLMVTERCFIKENFGCKRCGTAALVDRRGESFPLLREFGHRNIILNSVVTYIGDRQSELRSCRINSRHLIFTNESAEDIVSSVRAHERGMPLEGERVRRAGRRDGRQKPRKK